MIATYADCISGRGVFGIKKGDNSQTAVASLGPIPEPLGPGLAQSTLRLPQQRQHPLWQLVGLRHHGGTGLLQNLRP